MSAATAAVPARENNVPAVATAPGIFFQPLRSRLACPGFSEQNSADSVNSKTTGITNRIINILPYLLKGGDCHYLKKKKEKNCHIIIALKIILHIKTAKA